MTPAELVSVFERFGQVGQDVDLLAESGVRKALRGVRVPGHQVRLKGSRIRVMGSQAPVVASKLLKRAAKGVESEIRGALP